MKILSTLMLFFFLATSGLEGQQLFILFDQGCMERIQYEQAIARQPKLDYFAYQITLSDGNKIVLETGVEGNVRQNWLPSEYLSCSDPRITAELADDINGNRKKVFMLIPANGEYLVQPVSMGAVFARQNNLVTYISSLASFQFDLRNVIIGENLAYNNQSAKVFFEGRENTDCQGRYLIRQLMPRNAYPVIDYQVHPTLGVLERRLGSDGETTVGGVVVARSVNGVPLDAYLANICNGTPVVAGTTPVAPVTYGGASSQPVVPYTPTTNVPTVSGSAPLPATTAPPQQLAEVETHSVAKGETLWGLSKRFGVNVDQLKEWNNLSNNTITVGQTLRVGSPAMLVGNSAPPVLQQEQQQRGPVAGSNPGAAQPVPYGGTVSSPVQSREVTTPVSQEHVVQAGETVASVALRYGYTEAKFREINGLGANEFIRIGQRLKTNDCNCPTAPVSTYANRGAAAPTTASNAGVVAPQAFGTTPAAPTPQGTPVGPTVNQNFAAPNTFTNRSVATPQPQPQAYSGYSGVPQSFSEGPTTYGARPASPQAFGGAPATNQGSINITNETGFGAQQGAIVPNNFRSGTSQSMNTLEGGSRTVLGSSAPTAFGQPVTGGNTTTTRATHVVQENETLYQIAQRYGLSIAQLRAFNGLSTTDVIIPFQRLYIN
ncbi:MAG: LysM peptidoglycan-binding domain-containing protein [Bacteroidota bacterium]